MNTTELIGPPAAPGRAASEHANFREMLAEITPLVGAVAGEGPPVIFLAGPWLLLALVLSGPFAFLLTLVVAMLVAATVLAALTAAILGTPYLLIRRVRSYRARRASSNDHAAQLVPAHSTRVAA
jgi:hypothetical protein